MNYQLSDLEKFWQWRLSKIIGTILLITLWVWASLGIIAYFSFNPYKYLLSGNGHSHQSYLAELYDIDDIARFKIFAVHSELRNLPENADIKTVVSERAAAYDNLKYLKMILGVLIVTGAITLLTLLLLRIVEYTVYGDDYVQKNPKKNSLKKEDSVTENEVILEYPEYDGENKIHDSISNNSTKTEITSTEFATTTKQK